MDRFTQLKLQVYRTKLELLEHAAEDQDEEEAKLFGGQATAAFRRLLEALNTMQNLRVSEELSSHSEERRWLARNPTRPWMNIGAPIYR